MITFRKILLSFSLLAVFIFLAYVSFSMAYDVITAEIHSVKLDNFTRRLVVSGSAYGLDFKSYKIEYGIGESPKDWKNLEVSEDEVHDDVLAAGTVWCIREGYYTVRLTVEDVNGNTLEDTSKFYYSPYFIISLSTSWSSLGYHSRKDIDAPKQDSPPIAEIKSEPDLPSETKDLPYIPGELIVKFKPDAVPEDSARPLFSNTYVLKIGLSEDVLAACDRYKARDDVVYAEPNYIYTIEGDGWSDNPDPRLSEQWSHKNTEALLGWDIQTGNKDIVIAIIDTGVDYTHPDLEANIWTNESEIPNNGKDDDGNGYIDDYYGYDFADRDSDPKDENGHGTHCAGIAGAVGNNGKGVAGVCHSCSIMSLRVSSTSPNPRKGGISQSSVLAEALRYAADNGAHIISLSLGGNNSLTVEDAIIRARQKGCVVVAGAGNKNSDNKFYPAAFDDVIAVAATDSEDRKTDISNYGSWIDLAAPGENILSTTLSGGYAFSSGTSMAAPYVAGLAGLILSEYGSLTNRKVEEILINSVDPCKSDKYIGAGRVNVYKALKGDDGPCIEAKIISPKHDEIIIEDVDIIGTATGYPYTLYYAKGPYPSEPDLREIKSGEDVTEDALGTWDISGLSTGTYSIILRIKDDGSVVCEDKVVVEVRIRVDDRVIYVDDSASGANDGTSWQDAYTTISAALEDLYYESGVTIMVAQGEYKEYFNNTMDRTDSGTKNSYNSLIAKEGDNPVIDSTFTLRDLRYFKISGLTFSIDLNREGLSEIIRATNCSKIIFKDNVFRAGPWIDINGLVLGSCSDVTVEDNDMLDLRTSIVTINFDHGYIQNNRISKSKIGISLGGQNNLVKYNLITNSQNEGIVICNGGPHFIINNTIDSCGRNGVLACGAFNTGIENNIITNNQIAGINVEPDASITSSHNNVWNNGIDYKGCSPGEGDISSDPLFIDPASGNYYLKANSPCIDAGNPDSSPDNDIGCYTGYTLPGDISKPVLVGGETNIEVYEGDEVLFQVYSYDPEGGEIIYSLPYPTDPGSIDPESGVYTWQTKGNDGGTTYYVTIRASADDGRYAEDKFEIIVNNFDPEGERIIYVDNSATGADDGTSWQDAYTTLSAALEDLHYESGVTIKIAATNKPYKEDFSAAIDESHSGTYDWPNYLAAKKGDKPTIISLVDGFSIDNARYITIDGLGFMVISGHSGLPEVVSINDSSNITFKNNAVEAFGLDENYSLLDVDGLVLDNCSNIKAKDNKMLALRTSVLARDLINSFIEGNYINGSKIGISLDGGICNLVSYNLIINSSNEGISISYGGPYSIANNTIDSSGHNGIVACGMSNAIVRNNIVTNNQGAGIRLNDSASIRSSYNDVWNNSVDYKNCSPGKGAISSDPLFVDPVSRDYHLRSNSPCIDAGDPNDLLGSANWPIDIGCYTDYKVDVDQPPQVTITSHQNGNTVSGTITITVDAIDDRRIEHVDFYFSDVRLKKDETFPYSTTLDTKTFSNGTYILKAIAMDRAGHIASHIININIENIKENQSPVLSFIGDRSVDENDLLEFTISATDPDGDTLTYSAATKLPDGTTLEDNKFSWTPSYTQAEAGPYKVIFKVTDGKFTDSEEITINVRNTNRKPVLNSIDNKTVKENSTLSFTIEAADQDGDELTYSASNLPPGASFDVNTRTFTWTPAYTQAGTYERVRFEVTDGELADSEKITITVQDRLPMAGDVDLDDKVLMYDASLAAQYVEGLINLNPTQIYAADVTRNGEVTHLDANFIARYAMKMIPKLPVENHAPEFTHIDDKTIKEESTLSFTIKAADPDGNNLTYSASNLPPGASFDKATHTFTWIPTDQQAGTYERVRFEVTDGELADSEKITITVQDRLPMAGDVDLDDKVLMYDASLAAQYVEGLINLNPTQIYAADVTRNGEVTHLDANFIARYAMKMISELPVENRAPSFTQIGNKTVLKGSTLEFTIKATDPDGNNLIYSLKNPPDGAALEGNAFTWTPSDDQAGKTYQFIFEVTDGELTDSEEITITVQNKKLPPQVKSNTPKTLPRSKPSLK